MTLTTATTRQGGDRAVGPIVCVAIVLSFWVATPVIAQLDTLRYDGLDRTYRVHVPPSYDEAAGMPVVFAFHGGFGSAENIEEQSGLSAVADEEGFLAVYPNGTGTIPTWNAGECCGYAAREDIDDVGFVAALIDHLAESYTLDWTRMYATGISNGGAMAYRVGCDLAFYFAAVAPVATSFLDEGCEPDAIMPVAHFHSLRDENIPFEGGVGSGVSNLDWPSVEAAVGWFVDLGGCTAEDEVVVSDSLTVTTWSQCVEDISVKLYLTADGGHSWPGGTKTVIGDSVSTAIDASREMWSYFSNYHRGIIEGIDESRADRARVRRVQFFPSPSSGGNVETQIDLQIAGDLVASIYDVTGRRVAQTALGVLGVGEHVVRIGTQGLSRGLYLVRFEVNGAHLPLNGVLVRR